MLNCACYEEHEQMGATRALNEASQNQDKPIELLDWAVLEDGEPKPKISDSDPRPDMMELARLLVRHGLAGEKDLNPEDRAIIQQSLSQILLTT
ncbi:hypothetical protein EMCG_07415 [[Emmonsia] crescens]|uniref:Uncharacterized protein n=1 Tax=[Emmonsia] crescens TaxID=73230 RepID=A0A0G2J5P7_9EURO|nr:hypothetical protein EMCG_07415 [Emmonsia crescens UAMH 3008]